MSLGHGASIVRDGLVLHLDAANKKSYPGTGTTWNDLSGNGNNGTLINGVGYTTDNNGALVFDGVDNYVSCGNPALLNFGTSPFTLSFVCLRTASGFQGGSYVNKGSGTYTGFGTRDGAFYLHSSLGLFAKVGLNTTLNNWSVETFVVNQTTSPYVLRYTNGLLNQLNYQETPANLGSISNSNNFVIGLSQAGGIDRYFNGNFSICTAYNRALSDQEIQKNFNALRGRYGI